MQLRVQATTAPLLPVLLWEGEEGEASTAVLVGQRAVRSKERAGATPDRPTLQQEEVLQGPVWRTTARMGPLQAGERSADHTPPAGAVPQQGRWDTRMAGRERCVHACVRVLDCDTLETTYTVICCVYPHLPLTHYASFVL